MADFNVDNLPSHFCVYPWLQFMIGPTEQYARLCCQSWASPLKTESGQFYSFKQHTLDEIWNGHDLKQIRKQLLSGKKISACKQCHYVESTGNISVRQVANHEWLKVHSDKELIIDKIKESIKNDYNASPPIYLDLRFGNHCNLQCRMCSPYSSSKISREYEELIEEYQKRGIDSIDENEIKVLNQSKDWYKDSKIIKNIYRWIPNVRKIYMTGGEPTLIKENWKLIKYIQENDCAKNIILQMNINCTHVNKQLLNTFKEFKQIILCLSVDGTRNVQEYIRYPSKWKIIESNIIKVLENTNERTWVSCEPVVQIYNILDLTDYLKWAERLDQISTLHVDLVNMYSGPKYLDIDILPKNVRLVALEQILNYEKEHTIYLNKNNLLSVGLKSIKTILRREPCADSKHHLQGFRKYTEMLDKKRNNSFEDTFPKLYNLLEKDGSWI